MHSLREVNELRVLKTVREEGPISRAALARRLKLSKAALSGISQRFLDADLITEVGKGASTERGGRREMLLAINPRAGVILAAEVEREYANWGLLDMNAQILARQKFTHALGVPPLEILTPMVQSFQAMLAAHKIQPEQILGMGVGIPGLIDYDAGVLREAYTLETWRGFPLRRHLQEQLHLPVFLENDIKTLTLGEAQFGSGRNIKNLVCVHVGDGIGAGIIVEGRLLRGASSSAGEIGYNEYALGQQSELSLLFDSQHQDWGDVLSHSNLKAAVRRGLEAGWVTRLSPESEISEIVAAAESGDALAVHLLKRVGWLLGAVCDNLIHCLNPPLLVFSGLLFERTAIVVEEIRRRVAQGLLRSPVEAVEIRTGMLGENDVLIGAAALVLEDIFQITYNSVQKKPVRAALGRNSREQIEH